MTIVRARRLSCAAFMCCAMAACGGGTQRTTPPIQTQQPATVESQPQGQRSVPLSTTGANVALPLAQGYSGRLSVRTRTSSSEGALTLDATDAVDGGRSILSSSRPCPVLPVIQLTNRSNHAIEVELDDIELHFPCSVDGKLFGASFYQVKPQPSIVRATKLGDGVGSERELEIKLKVEEITLPPRSTSAIAVLAETSTTDIALPVAPGSTTVLTSNSNVPTSLSFGYPSGQGASVYSAACFNAFTDGVLNPQLSGVPLVGVPSFFCHLDPGTASITFGTKVKFFIGNPKPDASVLGLDGPPSNFACNLVPSSTECDTPQFTISNSSATAFKNVVVGNVDDLRLCVPVTENTDCNKLVSPAPSKTQVTLGNDFQLLVADDQTYRAGSVPWDGLFRASISGPCRFNTGPDNNNGDVPPSPSPGHPGYSDSGQQGIGPFAEFDVTPTGTGSCTITMSEDPKFITADFTDLAHPKGRSAQLTITVVSND